MAEGFSGYAVVEVMGHNRFVGHVSETTLAGAGMLLLEVPEIPATETRPAVPGYMKYIPPASLYCVTPISEEEFLRMRTPAPSRLLSARFYDHDETDGTDDDDDDVQEGFTEILEDDLVDGYRHEQ